MIDIIDKYQDLKDFLCVLESRRNLDSGTYSDTVKQIVNDVRTKGDEALFSYTAKFDFPNINESNVKVSQKEIEEAISSIDEKLLNSIKLAASRIENFHAKQKQNSWIDVQDSGEILGQRVIPMDTVGVYVPGGKASYPSSVLMNVIPAKVAGVNRIIMTTPCDKNGKINNVVLAAAYIAGVSEIFKVGGAQAIAALAYGTKSIPKADKIVGPGNIFVALAKREVFGHVSIDSIAGPSEILIIADNSANPKYLAADLLSQAEHDELASAILLTDDVDLAQKVKAQVEELYKTLPREKILKESLSNYSRIIIVHNITEACNIANTIAPEHLELALSSPFDFLPKIKNAGAIFLGHYTPEPVGDYMAGPNHILPTNGTARFFSALCVDDFVKKSSILSFTKDSLMPLADPIITFANSEGLQAHALSIAVRKE